MFPEQNSWGIKITFSEFLMQEKIQNIRSIESQLLESQPMGGKTWASTGTSKNSAAEDVE